MDKMPLKSEEVTLLEILDRVLDKGVVISGDIVISVADIDLIYLGLRVLLSSVETMEKMKRGEELEPGVRNAE
ncbi:MAG: gas vesicle protein [Lentisphaerota bacterium]